MELIIKYPFDVFAAEGVKLVYDFGRILDHISKPACSKNAGTIYDALTMFEHYYENNESFDHYTHGIGPGIVGLVIHAFMEFMGELVNQTLDHSVSGPKKGTPLSVYVTKLHDIVSTVVTEESEESSGRLSKKVEDKKKEDVAPTKPKSRGPRMKQTERKHHEQQPEGDDIDDDIMSLSGSEDENQFTTLMSTHGMVYHPPSKKRQLSKYTHKNPVDINKKLDSLCELMEAQENKICRLQKENENAKNRIRKLKNAETKQAKPPPLAAAECGNSSGSDSDILEVKEPNKPDSTQPRIRGDSDLGSEDLMSGQSTQTTKKRKTLAHIDSASSADQQQDQGHLDAEDDTDVVNDLRQKKADLEERYAEMERKLLEQRMDNRCREFQDQICEGINHF